MSMNTDFEDDLDSATGHSSTSSSTSSSTYVPHDMPGSDPSSWSPSGYDPNYPNDGGMPIPDNW